MMETRLVKFLSANGAASRRAAGDLVKAGRVKVNGVVEPDPARRVSESDRVELDGALIETVAEKYYVMLNKPAGYTCSSADRHAEKLAIDLIDLPCRLFSAGRLDRDSEGLILFSNDGDYVEKLTHPRYEVCKRYRVKTLLPIKEEMLDRIRREGVSHDGELLKVVDLEIAGDKEYLFVLNEGKKREIRRICAAANAPVTRLVRIAVGKLELGNLKPGQSRLLTAEEAQAGLKNY